MGRKATIRIALGALLICPVAFEVWVYQRGANLVIKCGQSIEVGISAESLHTRLAERPCLDLRRASCDEEGRQKDMLSLPIVLGAQNWVLYVESSGSRVAAIRVRTEDSRNVRPGSAPPDREDSDGERPLEKR